MSETVVHDIRSILQRLRDHSSLKPSHEINGLFSTLVNTIRTHDHDHLADCVVRYDLHWLATDTQCVCSAGEYELELWWAKKIINSKAPPQTLSKFPYYKDYQHLVELEINLLGLTGRLHQALFIGSGPLPLSGILLAQEYNWSITGFDKDLVACEYGNRVINKLGLSSSFSFCNQDVLQFTDFGQYSVIILGGLVGKTSDEKLDILKHIYSHIASGTKVVVRSSHGLREFLYPSIAIEKLGQWHIENVVHPKDDLINSVIILCKN